MSSPYATHLLASYSANLLAYYQLNDTGATFADSGPNSLPLTQHAGFSLSQPSLLPSDSGSTANGCTLFSGGYGSQAASSLFSSLTNFAIIGWCQPPPAPTAGAPGYILGGTARWIAGVNVSGAELFPTATAQAAVAPSNASQTALAVDTVQPNIPQLVAAIYDGSHIGVYANGVLTVQTAKSGTLGAFVAYGVGANGAGADLFKGYLQHVAMWGSTGSVTPATWLATYLAAMQDLYVQGVQGNYPGAAGATFQAYAFPWSVEVLPANASRNRVTFVNDSDAVIALRLAATSAVAGQGIILAPNGGVKTIETYLGAFSAVHDWPQGYKSLTIMEE